MDFETQYRKRIEILLKDRDVAMDQALKGVLQDAARDHVLGSGNTIRRIMECCITEVKESTTVVVVAMSEMTEIYDKRISNSKAWAIVEPIINDLISKCDEKKLKAMHTASGTNLSERIIEASSLEDKYQLLRIEAKVSLDKSLSIVQRNRGKTLKDRVLYRINNNPVGVIFSLILLPIVVWYLNR